MQLRLLLLFLLATKFTSAQTITGKVTDSATSQPLNDAVISLFNQKFQSIRRVKPTNGRFQITRPSSADTTWLITTHVGYRPDTLLLTKRVPDTVTIRLKEDAQALQTVVIKSTIPPATIRNDTITFNPSAYPVRPRATLEDLLRRLPGIEVDKDGNITMNGQKVDRIYLDGKEFFIRDLRNATQTFPADIIAQLEVFDSKSDQSRLSGEPDATSKKAINIKLKKKNRIGIFGKTFASLGESGYYEAGGNFNSLADKNWLGINTNANNINNRSTGKEDQFRPTLQYRYSQQRLTAIVDGAINTNRLNQTNQTNRKTFLADSSLYEDRRQTQNTRNKNIQLGTELKYNLDTLKTIVYRGTLNSSHSNNQNNSSTAITIDKPTGSYLANNGTSSNQNDAANISWSHTINWEQKFHKRGRSLFASIDLDQSTNNQTGINQSSIRTYNQQFSQTGSNSSQHLILHYTEPLSKKTGLTIGYAYTHAAATTTKNSYDYDSSSNAYNIPNPLTSNHLKTTSSIHDLSAGTFYRTKQLSAKLAMNTQLYRLDNNNLDTDTILHQRITNLFPEAWLNYRINKTTSARFTYNGRTQSPTTGQLQPIPDLSNPLLIQLGNDQLRRQFDNNISAGLNSFSSTNAQNLQLSLQAAISSNKIAAANTTLEGGIQQLQYINVSGVYNAGLEATYGFPFFRRILGSARISARLGRNRDIGYINGSKAITEGLNWRTAAAISFHLADKFFAEANADLNATKSTYSLFTTGNSTTLDQNYRADLNWQLPKGITVTSQYNLAITGSGNLLPSRQFTQWNASLAKNITRSGALQARLTAYDLLNSAKNTAISQGPNFIETTTYNIPGRLFLFTLTYDFRKFSGS